MDFIRVPDDQYETLFGQKRDLAATRQAQRDLVWNPRTTAHLSAREKLVIEDRAQGVTLSVIAKILGRSRERVRQLEVDAWRKIRKRLRPQSWAPPPPEPSPTPSLTAYDEHANVSIEDLELSVRSGKRLRDARIETVGDLVRWTEAELLKMPGFGRKSLREVKEILAEMNLSLGTCKEQEEGTQ